jgi:outer membrane protein assembly factor BamB
MDLFGNMDAEQKLKIACRAALVSGIFCGVVALLLILNFWHMKQHEPLESKTIEALVERVKQEPNNEELKEEIRSFDLLARKAYFTSRWQVKTGTWLLLVGGIVLALSLKVYTDLRAAIEPPGELTEEILKSRANAQYWLFMAGGLILGLALVAAYVSNDYLKDFQEMAASEPSTGGQPEVQVIEVFPGDSTETETGDASLAGEGDASGTENAGPASTAPESAAPEAATPAAPAPRATAFNPEDFKRNQATFRGYMGQGISYHKNIPEHWNGPSGENIKWKVALSKPGFNTPVIWGDRLFVSGGDESARIVACYNRNTGRLLWEREANNIPGSPAEMPKVSSDTGLAAPTMAVDGKRVCAIFATGDVIAFDLEGNRIWARNLGVPRNPYGHASSLQVWGNRLVIQYDSNAGGRMLALDTSTGETLWDVARPVKVSWSSPILAEVEGNIQVVTTADPYVSGNDLETGEEAWKVEATMGEVGPSVAFNNGIVYATQEYAQTVAIQPGMSPKVLWMDDEYLSEVASPVAYNGLFFLATNYGVLVCYDGKTGEKLWEKEVDGEFWSSPMIADGKLYIIDADGVTHIVKADRTGSTISEPELGEGGYSLPVFAEGNIYFRGGSKTLYCIGN